MFFNKFVEFSSSKKRWCFKRGMYIKQKSCWDLFITKSQQLFCYKFCHC